MNTETTQIQTSNKLKAVGSHGDWRDDLLANGYVVVKNAIPRERAQEYQQRTFKWLKSFNTDLDIDNPDTWTAENLPVQSKLNTFDNYCVVHEKFMWDVRLEPGVLAAFAKIWGTEELLVSFDSLNVTFPNRVDKPVRAPWPHVDQSPFKKGLQCVQGIINLSSAGPEDGSLMLLPRSNTFNEEFFESQTDKSTWEEKDWRRFYDKDVQWFSDKGLKPLKVEVEPGDLILWDSRTVHWGGEPTERGKTIRTVIYATYTPAAFATKEALEEKKRVFEVYGATTHWPHDNIYLRPQLAHLPDGTLDPRNRSEPLEKPEMSDKLLRLAGLKAY